MKCVMQSVAAATLILCASLAFAQYEEDSYIEGYVGANYTLPMGYIKNDLVPDSLNATAGLGFDVGGGYYLKPNLIMGLYFTVRNMGVEEFDLNHRVFEFGPYGKFLISDLSESSFSPYVKVSAGLNFSKLVTKVFDEIGPVFRELSYDPTIGIGGALGLHVKTNERGAFFVEAAYHYDMMDGNTGNFKGADYAWGGNNQYVMIRAGIIFNISRKE